VLGQGWSFSAVPGGVPTRQLLDAIAPERPAYLDAADYHSAWLNTAALRELGVTADTPDPIGGTIEPHSRATARTTPTSSSGGCSSAPSS